MDTDIITKRLLSHPLVVGVEWEVKPKQDALSERALSVFVKVAGTTPGWIRRDISETEMKETVFLDRNSEVIANELEQAVRDLVSGKGAAE